MDIRTANPADAEQVGKVLASFLHIAGSEEGQQVFLHELKLGHHYVVLENNKTIVGVASWVVRDRPKHELAEITHIAVLAEARGTGAAQELFNGTLQRIQSFYGEQGYRLRKLFLLTHANNMRARKFYEKLGFRHEATLKDHYYKGVDECVYSLFF